MPKIYADYGYDVHSIDVDEENFARIRAGEGVSLDGQGFMNDEEGLVKYHWSFNGPEYPAFIILDNCAEFYCKKYGLQTKIDINIFLSKLFVLRNF
jgi:hypothetical protein